MEEDSHDIVSMLVLDKRQVQLKSTNMESRGFKRGMAGIVQKQMEVAEVVTDASTQITSVMSKLFCSWFIHVHTGYVKSLILSKFIP